LSRYKEKLEEQEIHFQTQQKTLAEHFEREKSILIAEQKKRDQEANTMMQQTQLHFQVDLKEKYSKNILLTSKLFLYYVYYLHTFAIVCLPLIREIFVYRKKWKH